MSVSSSAVLGNILKSSGVYARGRAGVMVGHRTRDQETPGCFTISDKLFIPVMSKSRDQIGLETKILTSASASSFSARLRPRPGDTVVSALRFWPRSRNVTCFGHQQHKSVLAKRAVTLAAAGMVAVGLVESSGSLPPY